jgi:hypothetical protein
MAADDRAEHHEGPEAAQRFERTLERVLTVSKAELTKREAAYKKTRRAKKTRQSRSHQR